MCPHCHWRRIKPIDLSDLRRRGDKAASGFAFEIDPNAGWAKVAFLNCSQRAAESMRSKIERYVCAKTQFKTEADGTLVAEIDWSKEPPEVASRVQGRLVSWLQHHIGYAVVIYSAGSSWDVPAADVSWDSAGEDEACGL
jgi:hypothetical protein